MRFLCGILALVLAVAWPICGQMSKAFSAAEDPYLWLEEITGDKALEWVKARNAESGKELAEAADFAALKADLLKILDSKERIPSVSKNVLSSREISRCEANAPRCSGSRGG